MSNPQKDSSERTKTDHIIKFSNNEERKLPKKKELSDINISNEINQTPKNKCCIKSLIIIGIGILAIIVIGIVLYFNLKGPKCKEGEKLCNINLNSTDTIQEEEEDEEGTKPGTSPLNFPSEKELKKF